MSAGKSHKGPALFALLDARAVIGSTCLWAWVDALYGSMFFAPLGQRGTFPELAAWTTFLLVVPFSLVPLFGRGLARRASASTPALLAAGAAGTAGSLLFALSAHLASRPMAIAGAVLCALFMTAAILAWGAVYCRDGMRSAVLYVAGGFACAIVPDLLFLLMAPPAAAIVPAVLPLLSMALLLAMPAAARSYPERASAAAPAPSLPQSPAGLIRRTLGVSVPTVCSVALIMLGLGYMQHQISFAPVAGVAQTDSGVTLQIVRGAFSIVLFAVVALFPRRGPIVYRVGLLAIVAGFSLMPFLYGTGAFWVSGAVILVGYTTFDVLIWIVVAQSVYAGLGDAPRIVCTVQMVVRSAFCGLGGILGMALDGVAHAAAFPNADAILVGYLMTIAIVLVLSSRDIWELFDARPAAPADPAAADARSERIARLSETWGLTEREREIFALLAIGRTQPWIAENLGISESTVNSHVRHIYSKSNIRNRQELLDLVMEAR